MNLKKYNESIQFFDKAIAINPNYFSAYQNKGNALRNLKKFEEAIKCYNKIIEIKPNDEIKLKLK
jgi:tetratricopeptide (TPR) repeat protein